MPFVLFAAPLYTDSALKYIEILLDMPEVRLGVMSYAPQDQLPPHLGGRLAAYWQLRDMLDVEEVTRAAATLAQHFGPIHRLFSHQEQLQVVLAQARERLGIAGMSAATAHNFRDKARMKQLFREAGIGCARGGEVTSEPEAWRLAEAIGFPLVLKPVAGAASEGTFRADDAAGLADVLTKVRPSPQASLLVEEFIVGNENSFDSICIGGEMLWHSLTHYFPSCLEVLRNDWIQWTVLLPREVDDARYDDIRAEGRRALKALGMQTGLSHLEWFRRADGSIAISEIAARPPGAHITTLMSVAHDFPAMGAWIRLMVHGEFEPPQRHYAAGAAYLRGQGYGRIRAVHGLEQAHAEFGPLVVEAKLPQVGALTSTSYEGDGYLILRHPETAVVRDALSRLVNLIQVEVEAP